MIVSLYEVLLAFASVGLVFSLLKITGLFDRFLLPDFLQTLQEYRDGIESWRRALRGFKEPKHIFVRGPSERISSYRQKQRDKWNDPMPEYLKE